MKNSLTLITGNSKKAEQIQNNLSIKLSYHKLDLVEIQSTDVIEVASRKAEQAYSILGTPVIVEDTALSFEALGGMPGTFIKWFLEAIKSEGLCMMLHNFSNRRATASTCIALCNENGLHTFLGETTGTISEKPQGNTDFGWNNIFIADGQTVTWAEMSPDDVKKDSMRLKAITKLEEYLTKTS